VKAFRQNVEEKATDELVDLERHGAIALVAVAAIILVAEGDAGLVERDQPPVRDRDAVGAAGQIGEHGLGASEGRLGIDHPCVRRNPGKEEGYVT
jgi:hypothetical protein